jgi:hypothetical protein
LDLQNTKKSKSTKKKKNTKKKKIEFEDIVDCMKNDKIQDGRHMSMGTQNFIHVICTSQ